MIALTAPQFVAEALDLLPFPASASITGVKEATGDRCYLCGAVMDAPGWDRRDAFGPTFTNTNLAALPASIAVCQSCAAVSRGESWATYAARRPDLGLKTVHPISWRSYPHLITRDVHLIPRGEQWRDILLDPPEPPFVAMIPITAQKHLLFRCAVAWDRERYPVQFEEERVWIDRARFGECVIAAEDLLLMGMSREGVETGRYNQEAIRKAGVARWRAAEAVFAPWRRSHPAWVRLAVMIGRRPERKQKEAA